MKIGISTWACTWGIGVAGFEKPDKPMDARAMVERAKAVGAQVVQFADNLPATDAALTDAAAYAKSLGIACELGFAGSDRETLEKGIELTIKCGASLMRTLPHRGDDVPDPRALAQRLRDVRGSLESNGVTLALENHDHYQAAQLREAVLFADSKQIGICLDTVNNYGTGESWRETMRLLADLTVNFHVKDFLVRRVPQQTGFRIDGAPVGQGLLDLEVCAALIPGCANWIIEQWTPWQGGIAQTVAREREWVDAGMTRLRALAQSGAVAQ